MAIQKYRFEVQKSQDQTRLDHFLTEELTKKLKEPISKAKTRTLILAGAVHLNGKRVRIASKPVFSGARIEVYFDQQRLFGKVEQEKRQAFVFSEANIIFEDDVILVVNKPAGLPTQPTLDEARDNFYQAILTFLKKRDGEQAYLGMHHRLDRDTSGIMVFAKSKKANPGLAKAFAEHLIQKTYRAIAVPNPSALKQWQVKNFLAKKTGPGKRSQMQAVRSGGDPAWTDFRLLEKTKSAYLIEALPRTGRMHQIRVHLSDSGMPILGDFLYGAPAHSASRVMLHAFALEFPHPVSGGRVSFSSPLPQDFEVLWKKLSE